MTEISLRHIVSLIWALMTILTVDYYGFKHGFRNFGHLALFIILSFVLWPVYLVAFFLDYLEEHNIDLIHFNPSVPKRYQRDDERKILMTMTVGVDKNE